MASPESAGRYTILWSRIENEEDLETSRRWARSIAEKLGFNPSVQTRVATAVSEVSLHALGHGGGGVIDFQLNASGDPQELVIQVEDRGWENRKHRTAKLKPKGLGFGLEGSRRLVSRLEFDRTERGGALVKLYLALPQSMGRFSLKKASEIRDEIISSGELDPILELKRQNQELLESLRIIEMQKRELAGFNQELRESEEKQRRTSERLQAILENLPDSIVLFDSDGALEFSNGPARTLANLGDSDTPFGLGSVLEQAMASGQDFLSPGSEGVLQRKVFGEDRYFLQHVVNLIGSSETSRGALLLLRDITELRLIDDLKSDMLGTLSHEIKGPITSVRMAVLLLLDKTLGQLSPAQQELAETARVEIERLLRLLNTLLDVQLYSNEIYSLQRSWTTVSAVVARSLSEMDRVAKKRQVGLCADEGASLHLKMHADPERLVYCLNNLISNAIKFSPAGETVVVTTDLDKPRSFLRIGVKDRGPGIPKRYHQLIFNRYAKAPGNREEGVGVGLTIARGFARAHGGDVTLHSEPGNGSHFAIEVPLE